MSIYGIHKLCRSALHDLSVREALKADPAAAMERFPLTAEEKQLLQAFLSQHQKTIAEKTEEGKLSLAVPVGTKEKSVNPLRDSAFVDLVHTVLNSNEFVYRF